MLRKQAAKFIALLIALSASRACAADPAARWHELKDAGEQAEIGHDYGRAEKWFQQALSEAEKLNPNTSELEETLSRLASSMIYQGKIAEAQPIYKRAIAIALNDKNKNRNPEDLVWLDDLSDAYDEQARGKNTELALKNCLELRTAISKTHAKLGIVYWKLSQVYVQQENYKLALDYLEKALAVHQRHAKNGFWPARDTCSLAEVHLKLGHLDQVNSLLERSRLLTMTSVGMNSALGTAIYRCFGGLYYAQRKFTDAEHQYEVALKIDQALDKAKGFDQTIDLNCLADFYEKRGNNAKAVEYYNQSMDIISKRAGEKSAFLVPPGKKLASLYRKMHRPADAAKVEAKIRGI